MKTLVFFLFSLVIFQSLSATEDTLSGPHKGRLKTMEGYRVEVVGCNDYLEIYLYTSYMEPIHNYDIVGEVKFFYQGETYNSSEMAYYGTDGFTARINSPGFMYCRVTFDIDGKILTEKFENECVVVNAVAR